MIALSFSNRVACQSHVMQRIASNLIKHNGHIKALSQEHFYNLSLRREPTFFDPVAMDFNLITILIADDETYTTVI